MQPGPPGYPPQQQPPQQPPHHQHPPAANPGQTAGILMLVAALALAVGVFTKSWVTASWDEGSESVKMGPLGIELCDTNDDDGCKKMGWGEMRGGDADISLTARLSLITGLASMVCAGIAGIMALSRSGAKVPVGLFIGVFSATAGVMAYFVVRTMSDSKGEISFGPGYSSMLGIGGVIMASIVVKAMIGPLRRPLMGAPVAYGYAPQQYGQPGQPMMMAPPPPPPPQQVAPACPRCRGQLQFVAQYQRYFCTACQQYA